MTGQQNVYFHIGLSRAASTALQRDVFPAAQALGKGSSYNQDTGADQLSALFTTRSPTVWREEEGQKVAQALADSNDTGTILLSREHLYNNYFFVGFDNPQRPLIQCNPYFLAEHLRAFKQYAWGDRGKVGLIFLARNQADWLISRYSRSSHRVKKASQEDFQRKIGQILEKPAAFGAQTLEFDLLTTVLGDALGPGNVLPEIFERISEGQVLRNIVEFTGLTQLDVDYFNRADGGQRYTQTSKDGGTWVIRAYKPDWMFFLNVTVRR
ncbi:MAG: hypothetical protein EA427_17485 [Spirochaetaceae bacterium]|nr:MAG: hypothetical protein EA427_17485 [Spirochaetaceae bacterium]